MNTKPFAFRTEYNPALKAYEVYVVEVGFVPAPKGKGEDANGYPIPVIVHETKTTVTVECGAVGMGNMGWKPTIFYKTREAAWKAAAKALAGRKVLTLEETEKAVTARAEKERLERIKFLKAELKRLGA
jgi:hypothetical protein